MPYRCDRNQTGGGVTVYVREGIPSKTLEKHELSQDIEGMFVKINFRKVIWLPFGAYHPPSQNDQYYFEALDKALICYTSYDRMVLIGDFNSEDDTRIETRRYLLKKVLVSKILQNLSLLIYFQHITLLISRTQKVFQIFLNW